MTRDERHRARLHQLRQLNTRRMTLTDVAHHFGTSIATAHRDLHRIGRTLQNGGYKDDRPKLDWSRINWAAMTNREVAETLGCNVQTAWAKRRQLNAPKGPDGRKPRPAQILHRRAALEDAALQHLTTARGPVTATELAECIRVPKHEALGALERLANSDRLHATYPDTGPATYALPTPRADQEAPACRSSARSPSRSKPSASRPPTSTTASSSRAGRSATALNGLREP